MENVTEQPHAFSQQDKLCDNCGRPFRPHCPTCGSMRTYGFATKRDWVTRPNGQREALRVYRCLTCSTTYNDDDWRLRCTATPQHLGRPSKAATLVNPKVPDFTELEPNALQDALAEALRKRGQK